MIDRIGDAVTCSLAGTTVEQPVSGIATTVNAWTNTWRARSGAGDERQRTALANAVLISNS
jgi:hypothetical protein